MEVISRWIWSRSDALMNVLCSSNGLVGDLVAARSAGRCAACASSSLNVPIIPRARAASTMRSAWA